MADAGAWRDAGLLLAALLAVLWLPGAVLGRLAGLGRDGLEREALAVGLSIALWPLAMLWFRAAGLSWTVLVTRALVLGLALMLVALVIGGARRAGAGQTGWRRASLANAVVVILTCAAAVGSWWHARELVAAPWVDGYHHTLITQLILEQRGLPDSFAPYLAVERFYYHFGFHSLAATVALVSGLGVTQAVLWTGQALCVLTVPAIYLVGRRLVTWPLAAALAAALPAGLYWFPAYYLSWGRFTQLAGLVLLPVAGVLAFAPLLPGLADRRRRAAAVVPGALAAAGLVLVHYRVALAFGIAVAVFGVTATVRSSRRRLLARHLVAVTLLALLLAAPWLGRLWWDGVGTLRAASSGWYAGAAEVDTVPAWLFTVGQNLFWFGLAAVGLVAAALARRRSAVPVLVTLALVTAAANPARFGLPSSWMLPAFAVAIAAWLPVGVGLAYLADGSLDLLRSPKTGRRAGTDWLGFVATGLVVLWAGRLQGLAASAGSSPIQWAIGFACAVGLAVAWRPAALRTRRPLSKASRLAWAAAVLALGLAGTWSSRDVLNTDLVLLTHADLAAAGWVRANTPPEARFLVRSGMWQLGTYRGLDGGYWLPVLTGRATTMPAIFYNYGTREYGAASTALAERVSRAGELSDEALVSLMREAGAGYVYLGPATAAHEGGLTRERLEGVPELERVYDRDGVVVFRLRDDASAPRPSSAGGGGASAGARSGACRLAAGAPGRVPAPGPCQPRARRQAGRRPAAAVAGLPRAWRRAARPPGGPACRSAR